MGIPCAFSWRWHRVRIYECFDRRTRGGWVVAWITPVPSQNWSISRCKRSHSEKLLEEKNQVHPWMDPAGSPAVKRTARKLGPVATTIVEICRDSFTLIMEDGNSDLQLVNENLSINHRCPYFDGRAFSQSFSMLRFDQTTRAEIS